MPKRISKFFELIEDLERMRPTRLPKAGNFSGFDIRFDRKPLKNDVSDVKKSKNFRACGGQLMKTVNIHVFLL